MATTIPDTLQAFLFPYAMHLRANGWVVDAATSRMLPALINHFDTVHNIPWTRSVRDPRNLATATRQLRRVLTENHYDVVHTHTPIASFLMRTVCGSLPAKRRPRIVYTAHGFHFHPRGKPVSNCVYAAAEKIAGRWCDRLVVINQTDYQAARRLKLAGKGEIVQFPGIGIDLDWYEPSPEMCDAARELRKNLGFSPDDVVFTMLAEMTPNKNHHLVLHALEHNADESHHVVFAGDGELRESLEEETRRLHLEHRVHFLGVIGDVRPLVLASAATLLPSRREGLPRVVLESLALGVPVIGTNIRGNAELVGEDGGILIESDDSFDLARAMRVLARSEIGPVLPVQVRNRLAEYSLPHLLDLHDDLYGGLLQDAGR
jgi:glycosyltransferase involved in cell wall biosynthesis